MRLVGRLVSAWLVVGCGLARSSATDVPASPDLGGGGGAGGASGASPGGSGSGGKSGGAAVPLVAGEYWVHTDALAEPVHVRIVSATEAVVDAVTFTIERSDGELSEGPGAGGGPALHGPVVLRGSTPAVGVDTIALTAGPNGTLGEEALIRIGTSSSGGCLQAPSLTWQTAAGSVERDELETEVSGPPPDVALLPWEGFVLTSSKPAQDLLSNDTAARLPSEGEPIELAWSPELGTKNRAYGRFPQWVALVGREVELGGRLVNTNGAGAGGVTDWTVTLRLMDFGPSRSGLLDFAQSAPADLVVSGAAQILADDPACASETAPDARACLQLGAGSRLALRLAGPLTGLRVDYRVATAGGAPTALQPVIRLVAADGTPSSGDAAKAFAAPVEEVFALVDVPSTFNHQIDPACAQPLSGAVLVDAIEPVP